MSDNIEKLKQFAAEIVVMKHKARDLRLYKTMHAIEEAVTAVGWEIANIMKETNPDVEQELIKACIKGVKK